MLVEDGNDGKTKVTLMSKPELRSIPFRFLCPRLEGQFGEVANCLAKFWETCMF